MRPIVFRTHEVIARRGPNAWPRIAPSVLGGIGLASGVCAVIAVGLGVTSWMVFASAFVVWCLSGWRLFFADEGIRRNVRILGYVFLSTGLLVAAAIIAKLYLVALGPAWKL